MCVRACVFIYSLSFFNRLNLCVCACVRVCSYIVWVFLIDGIFESVCACVRACVRVYSWEIALFRNRHSCFPTAVPFPSLPPHPISIRTPPSHCHPSTCLADSRCFETHCRHQRFEAKAKQYQLSVLAPFKRSEISYDIVPHSTIYLCIRHLAEMRFINLVVSANNWKREWNVAIWYQKEAPCRLERQGDRILKKKKLIGGVGFCSSVLWRWLR